MNEQEMQQHHSAALKATELFMQQVWRERGPLLGTPVEEQLVKFGQELAPLVYLHLTHLILGGEPWVELRRTQQENDGPVWQAIRAVGIDPLHIGSHIDYRALADGRVEQVLRHAAPGEAVRYVTVWSGPEEPVADDSSKK